MRFADAALFTGGEAGSVNYPPSDRRRRVEPGSLVAAARLLVFAMALAFVAACDPLIGPYSVEAYSNATSLKARSLALVTKAGNDYALLRAEAEQLMVDVDAAYEFAAGNPRNQVSAAQWQILRDPDGALLGGFVQRWQAQGTINAFVREENGKQISAAFDQIICLEVNKNDRTACRAV
jgi:hypothetical protein